MGSPFFYVFIDKIIFFCYTPYMEQTKLCNKCNQIKSINNFSKSSSKKDGLNSNCKTCVKNRTLNKNYLPNPTLLVKICTKCKIEKTISEFNKNKQKLSGYHPSCKKCQSDNNKKLYIKNANIKKQQSQNYYINNKENIRISAKKRRNKREKIDPGYKLKRRLSNRLHYALKNIRQTKNNKSILDFLGISIAEYKIYIESKFESGMNWDNYGDWEIDHIIPLSSALTEQHVLELSHYLNTRPMWITQNRSKSNKYVPVCWQKFKRDQNLIKDKAIIDNYKAFKARDYILNIETFTIEHCNFIKKYEWLGNIGNTPLYCFTARINGILSGVVLFTKPNSRNYLSKKELLLSRGACASWTPKNLNSRLVMFSCNYLVQNTDYRIFSAYSDFNAGEYGTIYQACNFDYLGNTFGASYLYTLDNGKKLSRQSLMRTSFMKKQFQKLGLTWDNSWIKNNGFKDYSRIPANIKNQYNLWINSLPRQKVQRKGKYVIEILRKGEKSEKNWIKLPYPKR